MKKIIKFALPLVCAGFSVMSQAHETGAQTLGSALTAKDIFRTECFSWKNGIHPAAPTGDVNGGAARMTATVSVISGNASTIRIRALPGGALSSTTSVSVPGNGLHYFVVSHTTAAAHTYTVDFHCENAADQHTGTGYNFTGNPPNVTPAVDFVRTFNQ